MNRSELSFQSCQELCELMQMEDKPQIYVIATGAASRLQSTLWEMPGASAYLVGAEFPYHQETTQELLGFSPEKYVSVDTAIALAQAAYMKAQVSKKSKNHVGLGVTCSAASLVEHRGDHRVCVAVVTNTLTRAGVLSLGKATGFTARAQDDLCAEILALKALFSVTLKSDFLRLPEGAVIEPANEAARQIFLSRPYADSLGRRGPEPDLSNRVIVPITANPFHEGHLALAREAEALSGRKFVFQLEVNPAHKSILTQQDMLVRLHSLRGHEVVFSENTTLFIDKARKHPGAYFAIGTDTLDRMLDPIWGPVQPMLEEFEKLGTEFYVRDRVDSAGNLQEYREILTRRNVNEYAGSLFFKLPGISSLSSTALRNK